VVDAMCDRAAVNAWADYWRFRAGEPDEATREQWVETMAEAFRSELFETFSWASDDGEGL